MNTENDEKVPVEDGQEETPAPKPAIPVLSPELMAAGRSKKAAWKSGSTPGRWATIGCGLGIVVLIAALFAGSTLMRKTVWASYAGASQRLVTNLPGNLPPAERMRLMNNVDRFTAQLQIHTDPFPDMGEFQDRVRGAFEDSMITSEEVEEINLFLESKLPTNKADVPYSLP